MRRCLKLTVVIAVVALVAAAHRIERHWSDHDDHWQ